jgi:hypothetical protein
MPAFTNLILDTTPPVATWGDPPNLNPGDTLLLDYSSNEALGRAVLTLPDLRTIEMTIAPTFVSCAIPIDAALGTATITVYDTVGNGIDSTELDINSPPVLPPVPPPVPEPPPLAFSARSGGYCR